MILFEKIDSNFINKINRWRNERDNFLKVAREWEEYYYNDVDGTKTLFTKEQFEKIKSEWDIPITVNQIYAPVSHKISILAKSKPSLKVVSLDERGKPYIEILDKASRKVLYDSISYLEIEKAITDCVVKGLGLLMVVPDDTKIPRLKVKHVDLDEIILDPNSLELDLEDMEGFFVEKEVTMETFKFKYSMLLEALRMKFPDKEISEKTFVSNISDVSERVKVTAVNLEKIIVREYYDKVFTVMTYVQNPETGMVEVVFDEDLDEDVRGVVNEMAIDKEMNLFVRKRLYFGDYLVYSEFLPITKYPIKAQYYERRRRTYETYSLVHFLKDLQLSYTKLIQQMLVNGILTNNASYIVPEGSISPAHEEEWRKKGNKPGILKKYIPQIIDGVLLKPEREQFQNLSNFYPLVIEHARSGIEYTSGINSAVRGEPNPQIEVYSTLKSLQEAASYRIERIYDHILAAITLIGNVLIEYLLHALKPGDYFVVFNKSNEVDEVSLAAEMISNAKMFKYILVAIPTEYLPTHRLAAATEMFRAANNSSDPIERRVLIRKAYELSDMGSFREVQNEIDVATQLQTQLTALDEQLKRTKEINKQLENRVINTEIENRVLRETINAVKAIERDKAQGKVEENRAEKMNEGIA